MNYFISFFVLFTCFILLWMLLKNSSFVAEATFLFNTKKKKKKKQLRCFCSPSTLATLCLWLQHCTCLWVITGINHWHESANWCLAVLVLWATLLWLSDFYEIYNLSCGEIQNNYFLHVALKVILFLKTWRWQTVNSTALKLLVHKQTCTLIHSNHKKTLAFIIHKNLHEEVECVSLPPAQW